MLLPNMTFANHVGETTVKTNRISNDFGKLLGTGRGIRMVM